MVDEAMLTERASGGDRAALGRLLEEHGRAALAFAVALTGNRADAEDAAQDAFLLAVRDIAKFRPGGSFRAWLMYQVRTAAVGLVRSRGARRAREAHSGAEAEMTAQDSAESQETMAAVRAALAALEERYRLPLCLHYCQGLSQPEVAEVLEQPVGTVAANVSRGLERLRGALARAGFSAATLAGLLARLPQPAMPEALGRAIVQISQGLVPAKGTGPGVAASAAKGGLLMKIGLGVAAVGLAAGATFWAVGGKSGELAKPPEKAAPAEKPKFDIPIWHPDARWLAKPETGVGSGAVGQLDGPRKEVMAAWAIPANRIIGGPAAGPYGYLSYDPKLDRIHFVAGGARGYLDGPFSRARLGSHSYSEVRKGAGSGHYAYCTEPQNKGILRRLDFEKQEATTVPIPADLKGIAGMTCDSAGRLYIVGAWAGGLQILSPDGKIEKKPVELKEGNGAFSGMALALDEKRNRLYGSAYGAKNWYVYYWDLADNSFHGVLPIAQAGQPKRKRSEAGPFEGTDLYNQMGLSFGQDDPEKRFLYVYPNDTMTIFRLDLEKKEIWACDAGKDAVSFIPTGVPKRFSGWSAFLNEEGDLCTDVPFWDMPKMICHRRIK